MKRNVLFSTTRQWNPGDEFILMGVLRLLAAAGLELNAAIYNRNPETNPPYGARTWLRRLRLSEKPWLEKLLPFLRVDFLDNSHAPTAPLEGYDLVVFAGSPEWLGRRLQPLYTRLAASDVPVLYLGLGGSRARSFSELEKDERTVLERASLITVRDAFTRDRLAPLNPHLLPCPALFSAAPELTVPRTKLARLGLIYASDKSVAFQRVSTATHDLLVAAFRELLARHECEIVCHYIDELPRARALFPGVPIHYHFDAAEYAAIYRRFDLVAGPRVHGIGLSASMGIPGIALNHDGRGHTAEGFGARLVEVEAGSAAFVQAVQDSASSLAGWSAQLSTHRAEAWQSYLTLVRAALAKIGLV